MKKINLLFLILPIFSIAQVGINNASPVSSLDIISKGNTASTKALSIKNSSSTEILTFIDNGALGIGVTAPAKSLDVETNNDAIRLRTLASSNALNTDGTVRTLVYSTTTGDVNHRLTRQTQSATIANGASVTLTDITGGVNGMLLIRSAVNSTTAGSNVMVTFNYARRGLGLLGIAVDNGPTAPTSTRTATAGDDSAVNYNINTGTFIFTVTKPSANTIRITNNSGASRDFVITVDPML